MARRLALLLVCACALAPAAHAAAPATRGELAAEAASTLTTQHFELHYSTLTQAQADALAATAEHAYELEVATWSFPAPLRDGDGLIDVYVTDLHAVAPGMLGMTYGDAGGLTSSGYVELDATDGLTLHVVAHELFHLIQLSTWIPDEHWLLEASAEWAAYRAEGNPRAAAQTAGSPATSLDCEGAACGRDPYAAGGYARWQFFDYLAQRFGTTFVQDVLAHGAATGSSATRATDALAAALAAHGTTLADAFTGWTAANAESYGARFAAATAAPAATVAVDHLAAKYVAVAPRRCATMTIRVTVPDGLGAQPYFAAARRAPVPLVVSGGTASATVPCAAGYVDLPNPSVDADAQPFTVTVSTQTARRIRRR